MQARLEPGRAGRQVQARTNAFIVSWNRPSGNEGYVYHYDDIIIVDIRPLWDIKDREFTLGNKKGTELIMRLQQSVRPDLFNPLGAFDGKKNLFSFKQYPVPSGEFNVPWETGRSGCPREVVIKVVFVKRIDVSTLHRLTQGHPDSIRPESDSATALNMLNLFVQSTPRMTEPRIYNAKSFFTEPSRPNHNSKIRPLELWRGIFQSVRPTMDRIIVNVDTTIGVILPKGSLESICADFLNLRNLRDLNQQHVPKLRLFLKGVKVQVDIRGHAGKRAKVIKDVIPNVGNVQFDKGGEVTTVAEHFQMAHQYPIRPGALGVRLGSDGVFPMSVCKTVTQLYKNRASPDVVKEALDFSPRDPRQRLEVITTGWQHLKYDNSSFLRGAGIGIDSRPVNVRGRLLPSPKIRFGNKEEITPQRPGAWDVMRRHFSKAASVPDWVVVDFANVENRLLTGFIEEFGRCMMEKGIKVNPPRDVVKRPASCDIPAELREVVRGVGAQFILVILPESAPEPYRLVKRFGDITSGVATQCVKWSRKLAGDVQQGRVNQYLNNLILKINAKLGGINYIPDDEAMNYLQSKPAMIFGADVSHPGPGSHQPSVASLVASMDDSYGRYVATIRLQASRTEIINDLSEMFEGQLKLFFERNKNTLPQRIFFFRDGVSEGEFQIVLQQEVQAMEVVLRKAYDSRPWPRLTFIVVGKRHHIRFFGNQEAQDPKGNGNIYAGFVVDQDITHPVYSDFYLQSQPGLKGTSRPSHYTVLRNDSNLTADNLQQIAYALCHCYSRATRSVKIPAPVYYADLVCRRAKFHYNEAIGDIDMMSVASDEQQHLDHFQQNFEAINPNLKRTMYFV